MLHDAVGPRRVLLTLDAVGGVWQYALDLAAALGQHSITCLLAGFGPEPTPAQRAACAAIPNATLVWTGAPLDWMVAEEAALDPASAALTTLAQDWGAELLHLNLPSQASRLPPGLPVIVASHSCVPSWWQAVRGTPLPAEWRWQWRRNRLGFDRADAVLAPSASHGAALRAVYGAMPTLRVVFNTAQSVPSAGAAREKIILAAGRWWDEAKNGAVLDAGAPAVPWPVVLAGPLQGPNGAHIRFANVHTTGSLPGEEVRALMRRAAIFAAPSRYEPFGLAVLEAALSGAALVLADRPGFRELWHDAALFLPPEDPAAWAAAFTTLAADPASREALARRGWQRAQDFTPQRQTDGVLAAYAAAASRRMVTMELA
jgi:glycosyltransferase involved in cell wall biosynthesis